MKKIYRFFAVVLAFMIVFTAFPIQTEASTVKLNKTKTTIYAGKSETLKIKGTKKKVSWSSNNKKVATVSQKGKVTAKKEGTATITAKVGKKSYKCKVTVKNPSISATKKTLTIGESFTLKLKGTEIKSVKTSNKKVATVSKKGEVLAKGIGKATITLNGKDGKAYKCKVTVKSSTVDWNGGDITLDSIGIKIPTMTKFNEIGLSSKDVWWTGDADNDKKALSAMNRIYLTCQEFGNGIVAKGFSDQSSNGFSVTQNRIWWAWTDGLYADFSLTRDAVNGYYILEINRSLKADNLFGVELASYNRDVVKTMISFVSSEVNTVAGGIIEDMIGTTFISETGWTTLGDCKIQYDEPNSYKGHYVYKIKAK